MKTTNILITGATGFIGSLIVKKLLILKRDGELVGNICILVRNEEKAKRMFSHSSDALYYLEADITKPLDFLIKNNPNLMEINYIIHCAAPTRSAFMRSNPVETADAIVLGTKNILHFARLLKIDSMVYLSSMEVYGNIDCSASETITEERLGDLDITNSRSCYPMGKRMAENYCYSYYQEYNIPVKVARLSQVFGCGTLSEENRVFAQFAHSVIDGRDIILHTLGQSMGNYVDSEDAVRAIMILLFKGKNGQVYNIVNEKNTMRIREMAELVAHIVAKDSIKVIYDIPDDNIYGYASYSGLRLSAAKLRSLGWEPRTGLIEMYRNMMQEIQGK